MDPLGADVQDGRLYGRGSADMKGFIGLAVAQAQAFLDADLPFAVHFAFSYDEEVGCFGARELIADLREAGIAPLACIVGEPTEHGAGHRAQGRLPLALLRARQGRAFVADAAVRSTRSRSARAWSASCADMAERLARPASRATPASTCPTRTGAVVRQSKAASPTTWCREDCRFHYEFRNLPGADAGDAAPRCRRTPRRSSRR